MNLGAMIRNLVFIFSLTIFFNFFPPSYANVEFQEVTDFAGLGNKGSDWGKGDSGSDGARARFEESPPRPFQGAT